MHINRTLLLVATALTGIAIVGVLLWYWLLLSAQAPAVDYSAQKLEMLNQASDYLLAGNYRTAMEEAIRLTGDDDPFVSIRAQLILNEANFMIGTRESRLAAIQGSKSLFIRLEGFPEDQALIATNLLNYLSMAPDSYVFNEIFSSGPFSSFVVADDYLSTVKNLAEYSVSLKPTTTAIARIGWWHADKILEISRVHGLSVEERKMEADEILKIISDHKNLLTQEIANHEDLNPMLKPNFYFWQASLYQAVARVYPDYIDEASQSLQALHNEYEATSSEATEGLAAIAVLIPYAELYYAQALYEVAGETSLPQVREHLIALIEAVEASPDVHRASFINMIQRQAAQAPQYQMFQHPTYARFIEEVPEFRIFLESYGWSRAAE